MHAFSVSALEEAPEAAGAVRRGDADHAFVQRLRGPGGNQKVPRAQIGAGVDASDPVSLVLRAISISNVFHLPRSPRLSTPVIG